MSYGDTDELARLLKIRTPSSDQTAAMQRVLDDASQEIDDELDRADDAPAFTTGQTALVTDVCYARAVELWQQNEAAFGVVGLGAELGATVVTRDTWARHAIRLSRLKDQWGFA